MRRCSTLVAGGGLILALAGCGGGQSSASPKSPTPSPSTASTSASPKPDLSSPSFNQYIGLAQTRGFTPFFTERGTVEQQAHQLCQDNPTQLLKHFVGYATGTAEERMATDRAIIESYCSTQSSFFDATAQQYLVATSPSPTPPPHEVAPADFKIGVVITKKTCFGSAGCNVSYHIDPQYVGPGTLSGDYSVTYEMSGLEDTSINTFTITGTTASYDKEETGSTTSSKSVLSAKVTAVAAQ